MRKILLKTAVAIIFLLFFVISVNSIVNNILLKKSLEIEVVSPAQNDVWQVFYDPGKGYRENDSTKMQVAEGKGIEKISFDLYYLRLKHLRIDPGTYAGNVFIRSITFKVGHSSHFWSAKQIADDFRPLNQIDAFAENHGALRIRSKGEDPYFEYSGDFGKIDDNLCGKYEIGRVFSYLLGLILAIGLFIYFGQLSRLVGAIKPLLRSINRNLFRLIVAAFVFVCAAAVIYNTDFYPFRNRLEIDLLKANNADIYQVYYDFGHGFSERNSQEVAVNKNTGPISISFNLPASNIRNIRIDPGTQGLEIAIRSIKLNTGSFSKIWTAEEIEKDFKPLHQIGYFKERKGVLYIKTTGNDPYFTSTVNLRPLFEGKARSAALFKVFLCLLSAVIIGFIYFNPDKFRKAGQNYFYFFVPSILFLIFGLIYMRNHGVNALWCDDWAEIKIICEAITGKLSLNEMLVFHNGARPFVQRAIFLASYFLKPWTMLNLMYFHQFVVFASTGLIFYICKRESGLNWFAAIFVPAVLFSFTQYEGFMVGNQDIGNLIGNFFFLAALCSVYAIKNNDLRLVSCFLLCFLSILTMAQGLFSFLIFIPLIYLFSRNNEGVAKKYTTIWIVLSFLSIAFYLHGYSGSTDIKPMYMLKDLPELTLYFFNYLGSFFYVGFGQGLAMMAGFAIFAGYIYYLFKSFDRYPGMIAFASYGVLSAIMTAISRCSLGLEQAFASRYISVSLLILLVVALLANNDLRGDLRKTFSILMLLLILFVNANSFHRTELYNVPLVQDRQALGRILNGDSIEDNYLFLACPNADLIDALDLAKNANLDIKAFAEPNK